MREAASMRLPALAVLEIFAGEAVLSWALAGEGLQTLPPIEKTANRFVKETVDITDEAVLRRTFVFVWAQIHTQSHF